MSWLCCIPCSCDSQHWNTDSPLFFFATPGLKTLVVSLFCSSCCPNFTRFFDFFCCIPWALPTVFQDAIIASNDHLRQDLSSKGLACLLILTFQQVNADVKRSIELVNWFQISSRTNSWNIGNLLTMSLHLWILPCSNAIVPFFYNFPL